MSSAALRVIGLSKSFGATAALKDVSLTVAPGEVHALLGHNGSGKSTLIKIISGYHRPDEGDVEINGHKLHYPTNALALKEFGASFMHQDIGLVPTLSILENLRVGRLETGSFGRIKWRREAATVQNLLVSFGLELNPALPVSRLGAAQRSVIGLIRAFQDVSIQKADSQGGLIVLDEPTAALPEVEKRILFTAIKEVAGRGIGVLLVTHHLEEPLEFADTVSILRDGRLVANDKVALHSYDTLAESVMGRSVEKEVRGEKSATALGTETVKITGLTTASISNVSFTAHAGEIVGLTGLMGAGHEEVPFLVYGATKARGGELLVESKQFAPDPVRARVAGIALVSGDRLRAGGVLTASIGENITLPLLSEVVGRFGWLRTRQEESIVNAMLTRLKIKSASSHLPFSVLSGGNQQKALIGRWIESHPKILLLQEPTAGVDIGASQEVIAILKSFASSGGTVIFSSEQYEDVATLSDRVLVFRSGKVVSVLQGQDVTVENIVDSSYGRLQPKR